MRGGDTGRAGAGPPPPRAAEYCARAQPPPRAAEYCARARPHLRRAHQQKRGLAAHLAWASPWEFQVVFVRGLMLGQDGVGLCVCVGGNGDRGWKTGPQAVSVGSHGSGDAQGSPRLCPPDKSTTQSDERPGFTSPSVCADPRLGPCPTPALGGLLGSPVSVCGPHPPEEQACGTSAPLGGASGALAFSCARGPRGHFPCLYQCSLYCPNPGTGERHQDAQVGQGNRLGPTASELKVHGASLDQSCWGAPAPHARRRGGAPGPSRTQPPGLCRSRGMTLRVGTTALEGAAVPP